MPASSCEEHEPAASESRDKHCGLRASRVYVLLETEQVPRWPDSVRKFVRSIKVRDVQLRFAAEGTHRRLPGKLYPVTRTAISNPSLKSIHHRSCGQLLKRNLQETKQENERSELILAPYLDTPEKRTSAIAGE